MSISIRSADLRDEEALLALWSSADLIHGDIVERYRADFRAKCAFQPGMTFVAEIDGRIIGSIMSGYDGRRGWINCLAVSPEHRKQGLGSRLVTEAENCLTGLGCIKINLQVRTSNTGVLDFYRQLGYTEDKVVSMGKRLRDT